jgi:hypothetical protein
LDFVTIPCKPKMDSYYNVDTWQKANFDMPYQWEYSMGSPRTMVHQYNDVRCPISISRTMY